MFEFLFVFPRFDLTGSIKEADVAFMAGPVDRTGCNSCENGAVRLLSVAAVQETALAEIRTEFRKHFLQLLLRNILHPLHIEGGETRCIHGKGLLAHGIQLHMPGGVTAAAQLLGDFAGFKLQGRAKLMQHRAFPDTGISRESHRFSANKRPQFFNPLPRHSWYRQPDNRHPGRFGKASPPGPDRFY